MASKDSSPQERTTSTSTTSSTTSILALHSGRQLHYAHLNLPTPTTSSSSPESTPTPTSTSPPHAPTPTPRPTLILFFPGYLSLGTVPTPLPQPLSSIPTHTHTQFHSQGHAHGHDNNTGHHGPAHYISPTLPGNGVSSPTAPGKTYQQSLLDDLDALLTRHYPAGPGGEDGEGEGAPRIYVAGGSYGSVAAQMVYGHSAATASSTGTGRGAGDGARKEKGWRWGKRVVGLLLLAPFSPFRLHAAYTERMTWVNWLSVGPGAKWLPGRCVPWGLSWVVAWMLRDWKRAEGMMRGMIVGRMGEEERRRCEQWCRERGMGVEEWVAGLAKGARACVMGREGGWRGWLEGPEVLHSDWGFDPRELEEEWGRRVLGVAGDEDDLGLGMAEWLRGSYRGARLKIVEGGHLASLWYMDEIWEEMLGMT